MAATGSDQLETATARHPVRFLLGVGAYLLLAVVCLHLVHDLLEARLGEGTVDWLVLLAGLSLIALPAECLAVWDRGATVIAHPFFNLGEAVLEHRVALAVCVVAVLCAGLIAADHVYLLWERGMGSFGSRHPYHGLLREWPSMLLVAVGPFLFFSVCLSALYGLWIVGGRWRELTCILLGVVAFGLFAWMGFAWMANHGS